MADRVGDTEGIRAGYLIRTNAHRGAMETISTFITRKRIAKN